MQDETAQEILLVQAFEEADVAGQLLSAGDRQAATRPLLNGDRDAAPTGDDATQLLAARAGALLPLIQQRLPFAESVLRLSRVGFRLTPWIVAASFLGGLATNVLGQARHINLLSFPLFAILAWNLAMYAGSAGLALARLWARSSGSVERWRPRLPERLAGLIMRASIWRGRQVRIPADAASTRIVARALGRYTRAWWTAAGPLVTSRVRRALHLGAIAMIAGAIGGMYLRGLAFEYRATWESTLLGAKQVQSLMNLVLGPAAALISRAVPDVAPLEFPADGDAAPWLHLFGLTALIVVVIPRLLLWALETIRCRRLAGRVSFDLDTPYFRKVLSARRGAERTVAIHPYSYTPKAGAVDRLKTLLYDHFGARADIQLQGSIAYGDEVTDTLQTNGAQPDPPGDTCHIVLFNLAQSPEIEVHGSFLDDMKAALHGAGQLAVLIDIAPYRQRVTAPGRWQERLRAWERIVRGSNLEMVGFNSDEPVDDSLLEQLDAAIWSTSRRAGAING